MHSFVLLDVLKEARKPTVLAKAHYPYQQDYESLGWEARNL
jgi:hypothetical protein